MFSLLPYNTFGLEVQADAGVVVRSRHDLQLPLADPYLIIGRGSDVLFTDDFAGTALIAGVRGIEVQHTGRSFEVRVGAGEILDELIVTLLQQGITGLENLSAIPGTVGAAPIQNIGAYGVEIGDYITSVEAVDLRSGQYVILSREECCFGYRDSYFKQHKEEKLFVLYVNLSFPDRFIPHLTYQGLKDN